MNYAPDRFSDLLLYAPAHHYTHLWDLRIGLTFKHYLVVVAVLWLARFRLAIHLDRRRGLQDPLQQGRPR